MVLVPHRKAPNRLREVQMQVDALVREWIGAGVICARCGTTLGHFADKCTADLDEPCPGASAIELQARRARQELGL